MKGIKELVSNAITRFNPRHDKRSPARTWLPEAGPAWGLLAGEVHEEAERITVRIEVPGMESADFDVQVLGRKLVVRGEKRAEERSRSGSYTMLECAYGAFERVIDLPAEVVADKVRATYRRGVLRIELPKARRSEPRSIQVKVHGLVAALFAAAALGLPQRAQAVEEFPLEVQFQEWHADGKRLLYNAPVTITGLDGHVVFEGKSTGPYFVTRLPKGRYIVTTKWDGWTFSREVTVDEKPRERLVFSWRAPEAASASSG
jgi:HSP20 family protein